MSHLIFYRLYSGASCAFFRVKYLIERKHCHYCQNRENFHIANGSLAKYFQGYPSIISLMSQGNV